MPNFNLGKKHLTAAQKTTIANALQTVVTELQTVSSNLSDDERKNVGSVDEQNKLLINKVDQYKTNEPALRSPDVDWAEFDLDFSDRFFADGQLDVVDIIQRILSDFKIVHDYDNYQAALLDYRYTQYKATSDAIGFGAKENELKQFFPRTGSGGNNP